MRELSILDTCNIEASKLQALAYFFTVQPVCLFGRVMATSRQLVGMEMPVVEVGQEVVLLSTSMRTRHTAVPGMCMEGMPRGQPKTGPLAPLSCIIKVGVIGEILDEPFTG